MRIIIDMQGAQSDSRFRGIGSYTMSFAHAVIRNRGEHDIILALNGNFSDTIEPIRAAFDEWLPQENIRVWHAPSPVMESQPGNNARREAAEIVREAFLTSLKPDVIHISSLFEGYVDNAVTSISRFDRTIPVSTILYDLIPLLNLNQYLTPKPDFNRFYRRKINFLQKANLLLAISEFTKQEGILNLGGGHEHFINISAAANSHFKPLQLDTETIDNLKNKYRLQRPFILYSGGADHRKNLPSLIRAYARLPRQLRSEFQLVFVGKIVADDVVALQKAAKTSGLQAEDLLFTGYVTDEELVQIYNLCELFVFPSWHEGFGLPALEAMSCGAPVIASNTASLPEVIGNPKALFDPHSLTSMTKKMKQALESEDFREDLINKGQKQAKLFSWDRTGRRAISAFEEMAAGHIRKKESPPSNHYLIKRLAESLSSPPPKHDLIELAGDIARNHPASGMKQFFVDVSELTQKDSATGVQRVTRSVVQELLAHPPPGFRVEPIYATKQSDGYFYATNFVCRLLYGSPSNGSDQPIQARKGDIFFGLDLQHHVVLAQHSFLDRLRAEGVATYFLVYDLLPIDLPNYFAKGLAKLHTNWLECISNSDGLICISHATESRLKYWLQHNHPEHLDRLKIAVSHIGSDIMNSLPTKGLPDNYFNVLERLSSIPSFLMVGTIEPRKGHQQVLAAFEQLWDNGHVACLVLVGHKGWQMEAFMERFQSHPQFGRNLFWLQGISDEYLEMVYDHCSCLVAASEDEGFGLPLIEAAQHKLPIIARDIPVFREVAGTHAFYFKGKGKEGLSQAIAHWIHLFKQDQHPKSDDMPRSTWKQSVERMKTILLDGNDCPPSKQLMVDVSDMVRRDARTGIQRVVRSVLREFLLHPPEGWRIEPVFTVKNEGYRYARSFTARLRDKIHEKAASENDPSYRYFDAPVEYQTGDVFLGLDFHPELVSSRQKFFRQLRNHGVQVQFIVHDLLPIRHPYWFPRRLTEEFACWLNTITQYDGAICVSQATADDLKSWMEESKIVNTRPFKISVSHNGADIKQSIPSKGIPRKAEKILRQIAARKSFLMVGTLEPRKGHKQVLEAFKLLWDEKIDVNLIIVGKQGWKVKDLRKRIHRNVKFGSQLFWLEGISDDYLEKVYAASTCLIAASKREGFGLPLIEAAQKKLPIIARDIPIFREVAGDHAYYFQGEEGVDLALAIKKWLSSFQSGNAPSSIDMPWLTWEQSAQNLLTLLVKPENIADN